MLNFSFYENDAETQQTRRTKWTFIIIFLYKSIYGSTMGGHDQLSPRNEPFPFGSYSAASFDIHRHTISSYLDLR